MGSLSLGKSWRRATVLLKCRENEGEWKHSVSLVETLAWVKIFIFFLASGSGSLV